jgi:hypothetical protein
VRTGAPDVCAGYPMLQVTKMWSIVHTNSLNN